MRSIFFAPILSPPFVKLFFFSLDTVHFSCYNNHSTKEEKKPRRVLTREETKIFLEEAMSTFYYNLFIVGLETGMRIGELSGLQWEDFDFNEKVVHVRHSMTYFSKNGKYSFELHPTKTN
ncbi:MAG: tyrosine-type recombinase/integrase, partial [Oscillospiraceae bacterium]